jgi:hypothetical protein
LSIWSQSGRIKILKNFSRSSKYDLFCPAALPGRLARQPCPAALPGSLARQPCPATLPSSLARQPCPAALPGSLARQPLPAALPGSLARHPCPAALPGRLARPPRPAFLPCCLITSLITGTASLIASFFTAVGRHAALHTFGRPPCPVALPGSLARQLCPAASPGFFAQLSYYKFNHRHGRLYCKLFYGHRPACSIAYFWPAVYCLLQGFPAINKTLRVQIDT